MENKEEKHICKGKDCCGSTPPLPESDEWEKETITTCKCHWNQSKCCIGCENLCTNPNQRRHSSSDEWETFDRLLYEFADSASDRDGVVDKVGTANFKEKSESIKAYISKARQQSYEAGREKVYEIGYALGFRDRALEDKDACAELLTEIQQIVEGRETNYPTDIFSEPPKDWQKDIDDFVKTKGYRIDNITGHYARWQEKLVLDDIKNKLAKLKE